METRRTFDQSGKVEVKLSQRLETLFKQINMHETLVKGSDQYSPKPNQYKSVNEKATPSFQAQMRLNEGRTSQNMMQVEPDYPTNDLIYEEDSTTFNQQQLDQNMNMHSHDLNSVKISNEFANLKEHQIQHISEDLDEELSPMELELEMSTLRSSNNTELFSAVRNKNLKKEGTLVDPTQFDSLNPMPSNIKGQDEQRGVIDLDLEMPFHDYNRHEDEDITLTYNSHRRDLEIKSAPRMSLQFSSRVSLAEGKLMASERRIDMKKLKEEVKPLQDRRQSMRAQLYSKNII